MVEKRTYAQRAETIKRASCTSCHREVHAGITQLPGEILE